MLQNIYFTNTDNFTINDDELMDSLVADLEASQKREAVQIAIHNAKAVLWASIKATARVLDQATKS